MPRSDYVDQGGITSMKPMPWSASFSVTPLGTGVAMMLAFVTTRTYRANFAALDAACL